MYKILLVDNDKIFLLSWSRLLKNKGYFIETAESLEIAEAKIKIKSFHLVIIDVRMKNDKDKNDFSGIEFAARREFNYLPFLIITDYPSVENARRSLGYLISSTQPAVDYLAKKDDSGNDHIDEILLSIKNILKKYYENRKGAYGKINYLRESNTFQIDDIYLPLTSNELKVLKYLYEKQNSICSLYDLIKVLYSDRQFEISTEENIVKNIVYRLRKKIEPNNRRNFYIITMRGKGYKFISNPFDRKN